MSSNPPPTGAGRNSLKDAIKRVYWDAFDARGRGDGGVAAANEAGFEAVAEYVAGLLAVPAAPASGDALERKYPCADCGLLRTKDEGGTTFTVCDACWDKHHGKPAPASGEPSWAKKVHLMAIAVLGQASFALGKAEIDHHLGEISQEQWEAMAKVYQEADEAVGRTLEALIGEPSDDELERARAHWGGLLFGGQSAPAPDGETADRVTPGSAATAETMLRQQINDLRHEISTWWADEIETLLNELLAVRPASAAGTAELSEEAMDALLNIAILEARRVCFPDITPDHRLALARNLVARLPAPVPPGEGQHPDDRAVDQFATAMKAKLAKKRDQGYHGWNDERVCDVEDLAQRLIDHQTKGDVVDVANFAMMLYHRHGGSEALAIAAVSVRRGSATRLGASPSIPQPAPSEIVQRLREKAASFRVGAEIQIGRANISAYNVYCWAANRVDDLLASPRPEAASGGADA